MISYTHIMKSHVTCTEVDEAELLAAALQDDDDNEDNTVTTI